MVIKVGPPVGDTDGDPTPSDDYGYIPSASRMPSGKKRRRTTLKGGDRLAKLSLMGHSTIVHSWGPWVLAIEDVVLSIAAASAGFHEKSVLMSVFSVIVSICLNALPLLIARICGGLWVDLWGKHNSGTLTGSDRADIIKGVFGLVLALGLVVLDFLTDSGGVIYMLTGSVEMADNYLDNMWSLSQLDTTFEVLLLLMSVAADPLMSLRIIQMNEEEDED